MLANKLWCTIVHLVYRMSPTNVIEFTCWETGKSRQIRVRMVHLRLNKGWHPGISNAIFIVAFWNLQSYKLFPSQLLNQSLHKMLSEQKLHNKVCFAKRCKGNQTLTYRVQRDSEAFNSSTSKGVTASLRGVNK